MNFDIKNTEYKIEGYSFIMEKYKENNYYRATRCDSLDIILSYNNI